MFERQDYLNWDEYFMALAKLTAIRSKDPNSKVGAVIVNKNNRVVSIGYNGTPNGFADIDFPWEREGEELKTKYPFVCHAEANAIDNYRGNKQEFEGAKVYVTLFPCNDCAKKIIQNGIKEVIYACDKYANTNSVKASKIMFDKCGVTYRYFDNKDDILIEANGSAQRITDECERPTKYHHINPVKIRKREK